MFFLPTSDENVYSNVYMVGTGGHKCLIYFMRYLYTSQSISFTSRGNLFMA